MFNQEDPRDTLELQLPEDEEFPNIPKRYFIPGYFKPETLELWENIVDNLSQVISAQEYGSLLNPYLGLMEDLGGAYHLACPIEIDHDIF
jgi:hypothetical protein